MLTRVLQLPANRSVLLLGPRQTGKSTLIRGRLPADAWTVDLLQNEPYLRYSKDPGLFRREVEERLRRGVRTIFVDEVQRIPALLDEAHSFIESDQVRFLLTGSSARKLKRGGANLLAGRAAVLPLHPLIVEEHGEHFDLERALRLGALPRAVTSTEEEAREFLRDYVAAYLRMEVEAEALVRNLGGFARFLDVAAAQNGELLNASNVARDAALAERTVREYYKILEDTLVGFRLEAYRKSVRARLVGHSRFYLFDTGVTNAVNHRLTAAIDPDTRGRLFEQWLVLECKRRLDYARSEARLFFWRTNNGAEVDLLVEKHGKLVAAVEIKSGKKIDRSDLAGLRSFALENAGVPAFLVTPEAEPHRLEGVLVTNWRDFLQQFATWM
ncbi:MAG: ATP-binding protein [Planctomycetes bacterium]|nr:ATP-binding protein [Planctomycetota bacterium]